MMKTKVIEFNREETEKVSKNILEDINACYWGVRNVSKITRKLLAVQFKNIQIQDQIFPAQIKILKIKGGYRKGMNCISGRMYNSVNGFLFEDLIKSDVKFNNVSLTKKRLCLELLNDEGETTSSNYFNLKDNKLEKDTV